MFIFILNIMSRFKKAIERIAECIIPTRIFPISIEPWNYTLFSLSIISIDFEWSKRIMYLLSIETDFDEYVHISFLFAFHFRISRSERRWKSEFYVIL